MLTDTIQPQNVALLQAVLSELVSGSELFTAWNVTANAKKAGATQYHRDMKEYVHSKFYDGTLGNANYTRTPIPTPTGEAYLYHPIGADIQPFIDHVNSNPAPSVPPAQAAGALPTVVGSTASMVVAPPDPAAATTATGAKTQAVDAEGRLPLYADTLRDIGATPGGTVVVYTAADKVRVGVPDNQGAQPNHTYIVNADGRVRLSKTALLDLKSATGTYNVAVLDGEIVVTAA